MLFSDIEGSTLLLGRLGTAYAEALAGHRKVLRTAWQTHHGTELGTEGDSFFVVFPTADEAVAAAIEAQRGLEAFPWPQGEHVRVRIGIHTGSPQVHEDDYVGMDVHRAARIAASAHGGEVVLSSVTADLARATLPEGVGLRDLGRHRLKDIPEAEHLFQLTIDGLESDFPALRTLGASSSLPVPGTVLVGREHAVSEVTALMREPGTRLLTLTGPGGSGKTRLAIAVARELVMAFPDGVYFVPLSGVTRSDMMWTSIGEVLDVPGRSRMPPRLFEHVVDRTALFVLDNLEQVSGADGVVDQLLQAAPRASVVATSRRALMVPGEHLYPVPPLELPDDWTLERALASPAVQLFVQRARSVGPAFSLTPENVADVVAICQLLDGLPLAIELSAARTRLLTPHALLARIDQALDVATSTRLGPQRQRTLRDTIAWSYNLLEPEQQVFFRRVGVFAGGADLEAIAAVAAIADAPAIESEPLQLVGDLADASLLEVFEGSEGEPRVTMLQTIRTFARSELRAAGERGAVRAAHARHYLRRAQQLGDLRESQHLAALRLAETEIENFRDALDWAVHQDQPDPEDQWAGRAIDLQLCLALRWLWYTGGYVAEGSRWLELVLDRHSSAPSGALAECLVAYANLLLAQGDLERACDVASQGLTMARALDDEEKLAYALGVLGSAQIQRRDVEAARVTLSEALDLHRRIGNQGKLVQALGNLAGVEEACGNYGNAEELTHEALDLVRELGDMHEEAVQGQNLANLLATSGRPEEASEVARSLIEPVLQLRSPNLTMAFANTYMNILIGLGDPVRAAHLLGAEDAMHERLDQPNPFAEEEHQEAWDAVRGSISEEDWERHCQAGRDELVEDLLVELATADLPGSADLTDAASAAGGHPPLAGA
jgi:predicted ATPase/class 3 adenylate cyclase